MDQSSVGLLAALGAPALSVVGCVLWDRFWEGSPFALNLFKCGLASLLFAATVCADGCSALPSQLDAIPLLCCSSLLGIIIGDLAWLASMRLLGARRVILVDSLKPFLAAALGGALGERLSLVAIGAMALSVLGILAVALERTAAASPGTPGAESRLPAGYALAVVNVVFDVIGAVITKQAARSLGPWEIGLVRFGFAALVMALVALGARALADGAGQPPVEAVAPAPLPLLHVPEQPTDDAEEQGGADADGGGGGKQARPRRMQDLLLEAPARARWHELPHMSARAWACVSAAVVLVTFLAVGLGNVALFRLPLGLFLTLQSLGPIYALPISFVLKREVATGRAWAGSALAVLGVALFCRETFLDEPS